MNQIENLAPSDGPLQYLDVETYTAAAHRNCQPPELGHIVLHGQRHGATDRKLTFSLHFLPDEGEIPVPTYHEHQQLADLYFRWSQYVPMLALLQTTGTLTGYWQISVGRPWADVECYVSLPGSHLEEKRSVPPSSDDGSGRVVSLQVERYNARIYANNSGFPAKFTTLGLIILDGSDQATGQLFHFYVTYVRDIQDLRPPFMDAGEIIRMYLLGSQYSPLLTFLQSGGTVTATYDGSTANPTAKLDFHLDNDTP